MEARLTATRDTSERRQLISELVRDRGSVQVAPLASRFGVSSQTIRKDLRYLAQHGVAQRSYGGAIVAGAVNVTSEPALDMKRSIRIEEKRRIGRAAAAMIGTSDSIGLDAGTTTLEIARALPDEDGLTVLTNDLDIMVELARKEHVNVMVLGGALRRKNMAFYGTQTVSALDHLRIDKLFLGVDGFDIECGITTHHEPEAMLNRRMVQAARQVIAVADQSKLGRVCLHRIIDLGELDDLIIDGPVPDTIIAASTRFGFRIQVV
jgi:DeoR family transcriptional regulator of aga operon